MHYKKKKNPCDFTASAQKLKFVSIGQNWPKGAALSTMWFLPMTNGASLCFSLIAYVPCQLSWHSLTQVPKKLTNNSNIKNEI